MLVRAGSQLAAKAMFYQGNSGFSVEKTAIGAGRENNQPAIPDRYQFRKAATRQSS